MPPKSAYYDSDGDDDSSFADDLNDVTEKNAQLQDDLEEAKEALKDVKAKRAQDRKDWEKEKQLRRKLEAEIRTLRSRRTKAGSEQTTSKSIHDISTEFQTLRDEKRGLILAQELLQSTNNTLREDIITKSAEIKRCNDSLAKACGDVQKWETMYLEQGRLFQVLRNKAESMERKYAVAEMARASAERDVKSFQSERQEQNSRKRKLAAVLMEYGITKDDFDLDACKGA